MTGTTGDRRPGARVTVGDALLALAVAAAMAVGSPQAALEQVPPRESLDLLAWVLMGLSAAALLARRAWPRATLAVTTACFAGYLLAGYPYGRALFPILVALYSVGDQLSLRYSLRAAGASIAVLLVRHRRRRRPARHRVRSHPSGRFCWLPGCPRGRSASWSGVDAEPRVTRESRPDAATPTAIGCT